MSYLIVTHIEYLVHVSVKLTPSKNKNGFKQFSHSLHYCLVWLWSDHQQPWL